MAGNWFGRFLGDRGERAAVRYLKQNRYQILARQYRTELGEIDIIALDQETVVFVEVKTRKSTAKGQPFESVTGQKQKQLTRLAGVFLKKHGLLKHPARFDVISILWQAEQKQPEIQHFQNAFPPAGDFQFFI
ncbi:YraN family protein [Gimesia chilikensis]|uniref:YraN family protein n=1 Tax=Gimesia chilikensis TaxID=2605989 RepID=UPI0011EDCA90|nr:YraN family protein [Gimesia chilikensis]KAA0139357.1 YraN family protein [Gimesia chilikensis]